MNFIKKEQLESQQAYAHRFNECPICYPQNAVCSHCGVKLDDCCDDLCDDCLLEQEIANG